METVTVCMEVDPPSVIRELRHVVSRKPQLVRDLGPAKIVPLENSTILLVDPHADITETVRESVSGALGPERRVILVRHGFNIEITAHALSDGQYFDGSRAQVLEKLQSLHRRGEEGRLPAPAAGTARESASDQLSRGAGDEHAVMGERTGAMRRQTGSKGQQAGSRGEFPGAAVTTASESVMDAHIARLGLVPFDVLLLGETGSGKDVTARAIHARSPRADKPFLQVPIASLCDSLIDSELFGHVRGAFSGALDDKPGKFEAANGGTVYIPEISNISIAMQLKLLYFMQYKRCLRVGEDPRHPERCCDVRLIMASNEELETCVREGRMRADFYYRINGVSLRMPPLREHPEDIPRLLREFLQRFGGAQAQYHFRPEAIRWLQQQPWPGNIRQLEHLVRSLVASLDGAEIGIEELRRHLRQGLAEPLPLARCCPVDEFEIETRSLETPLPEYAEFTAEMQRRYITTALRRSGGSIPAAARMSGLTPHGFRKAMERLHVSAELSLSGASCTPPPP